VANIPVICAAMAAQIGQYAFPALRSLPEPEDQINPPVGIVMPGRPFGTYGTTLQGAGGFGPTLGGVATPLAPTDFNLDYLIVLSHASTLERIELNLYAWLGFESDTAVVSVPAAVARDPTLGGTVAWCIPTTVDPPGPLAWNGPEAFGTRIHFQLSAL
jgi:hypothetical protein